MGCGEEPGVWKEEGKIYKEDGEIDKEDGELELSYKNKQTSNKIFTEHFIKAEGHITGTERKISQEDLSFGASDDKEQIAGYMTRSKGEKVKEELPGKTRRRSRVKLLQWLDGGSALPLGWKMKGEISSPHWRIISSKGHVFQSLRQHFQYMVQQGYQPEEVEEVRSKMALLGWQKDQLLPRGWMYKTTFGKHWYCTKEGDLLIGHKNVLIYLENNEVEALKEFKLFTKKQGGERRRDLSKFKPSPYLPEGWICSELTHGAHINIVSQEGHRFTSYTNAATFMESEDKYTSLDIEKLFLHPDGHKHTTPSSYWVKNEFLPPGWRCKPARKGNGLLLRNPVGKTIYSYRDAISMMKKEGSYSKGDIEKLYQYQYGESHTESQTHSVV